ncbi:MAG: hypothetical protein GH155_01155 [Spirochaeta sp.]|nr:hypothetical protein [Spirochaeta sp.]
MTLVKLESLTPESLVAIEQRRKELKQLVKENSFIECNQENHEEAKRRRTALRKGRTTIQNEVKTICSQLAGVSRGVKDEGDKLIIIVQKPETKQQESVTVFEDEKERIRQENIRLEQERKNKLKEEITSWMGKMGDKIIQAQTSEDLEKLKEEILLVYVSEEAQQEFSGDIAWAKTQLELTFNNKVAQVELKEQKVERERLRREKEELEQKLRDAEQEKKESADKVEMAENQVKEEEADPGPIKQEDIEPTKGEQDENHAENVPLIRVWNVRTSLDGYRTIVKDPGAILAYLEEMEKGNELYIECDEITVAEYESQPEFEIS